ncbi:MAG: hypothetical protein MHM6MM_001758 [Cercozoa sp. M6MM]
MFDSRGSNVSHRLAKWKKANSSKTETEEKILSLRQSSQSEQGTPCQPNQNSSQTSHGRTGVLLSSQERILAQQQCKSSAGDENRSNSSTWSREQSDAVRMQRSSQHSHDKGSESALERQTGMPGQHSQRQDTYVADSVATSVPPVTTTAVSTVPATFQEAFAVASLNLLEHTTSNSAVSKLNHEVESKQSHARSFRPRKSSSISGGAGAQHGNFGDSDGVSLQDGELSRGASPRFDCVSDFPLDDDDLDAAASVSVFGKSKAQQEMLDLMHELRDQVGVLTERHDATEQLCQTLRQQQTELQQLRQQLHDKAAQCAKLQSQLSSQQRSQQQQGRSASYVSYSQSRRQQLHSTPNNQSSGGSRSSTQSSGKRQRTHPSSQSSLSSQASPADPHTLLRPEVKAQVRSMEEQALLDTLLELERHLTGISSRLFFEMQVQSRLPVN